MAQEVLGQAFVRVSPDTSRFGSQLQRQILPELRKVETAIQRTFGGASFSHAGAAAGTAFASQFNAQLGARTQAIIDPFKKTLGEAGVQGARTAARSISSQRASFQQAGVESGRVFGGGFGEGFAALAAFAIAARVRRFFQETINLSLDFEQAFAGVRKTVEGSPEQFARLEETIRNLGTRARDALPFAAAEIARVAQSAGQLGVPITDIEKFTETILKISTATQLTTEEAATSFARFAAVTQEPLSNIDRLGSAVVDLGNKFATNEPEILRFAQNIAGLAPSFGVSAANILALSAASRAAGANIEAGGTAIQQAIAVMVQAASAGGQELDNFLQITGLTADAFRQLADQDPATLFVELLRGIRGGGGELAGVLDTVGLGTIRIERELSKMAGAVNLFDRALVDSNTAVRENNALNKEFSIFAATNAQRLEILRNRITETRIELGGRLAPGLIAITDAIAGLGTVSIALGASFAGIVASAFAFNRFRNILNEVTGAIGGSRLSIGQFDFAMQHAQATGLSLNQVLRQLKQGTLEFKLAQDGTILSIEASSNAQTRAAAKAASFRTVMQGLSQGTQAVTAHQSALTLQMLASDSAFTRFSGRVSLATAGLRAQAVAAGQAARSVGLFNLALKGFGIVTGIAIGIDFLNDRIKDLQGHLDRLRGKPSLGDIDQALVAIAETGPRAVDSVERVIESLGTLGLSTRQLQDIIEQGSLGQKIEEAIGDPFRGLPGDSGLDRLRDSFQQLDQQLATFAGSSPLAAREALENLAVAFSITPDQLLFVLDETKVKLDETSNAARAAGLETKLSGEDAAAGADGFGDLASAADSAADALSSIRAAQDAYRQRVESFIPAFGELVIEQRKSGQAAGDSARDNEGAARRIADAQRALARAREDAARRIAEAERRLAEAEEDAIDRVIDARLRLEDSRFNQGRRVRDAQQALQDFQAALSRVGGPQTPEDLLRLRDLQQAATDARIDARRADQDALRDVRRAQEEGKESVEEAQRRLVEVNREAAEKIEDAQRRIAEAIEDAARRGARAARSVADTVVRTVTSLVDSFKTNTRLLNTFSSQMERLAPRVFSAFGDVDVGEAFLGRLTELGPEAIPLLRKLNKTSDKELGKIIGVFDKNIKAAKRAADLQFDRFPGNFASEIKTAVNAADTEAQGLFSIFDGLSDKTGEEAQAINAELGTIARRFESMAASGALALKPIEQGFLNAALEADNATERVRNLQKFINLLKGRDIDLKVKVDLDPRIAERIVTTVTGVIRTIRPEFFNPRQHGGPVRAGQAYQVGEAGRELFVPATNGTILPHRQTEKILRALSTLGPGQGFVQQVNVNQVAQDPIATARAVSWAVARGAVR